eukprot:6179002-Pleurochrysis_carterae.AAC.2
MIRTSELSQASASGRCGAGFSTSAALLRNQQTQNLSSLTGLVNVPSAHFGYVFTNDFAGTYDGHSSKVIEMPRIVKTEFAPGATLLALIFDSESHA